jgi:hypothetical protein
LLLLAQTLQSAVRMKSESSMQTEVVTTVDVVARLTPAAFGSQE